MKLNMKLTRKTLVALLSLILLLSLMLAFATSALGQGPGDNNETPPTAAGTSEQMATPIPTPEPIDCSKPIPGKTTTLGVDDEILVAFAGQSNNTHITKFDNTGKTVHLDHFWTWRASGVDLYQPRSMAITTADVDGDGKAEVITAVGNNNPGELEVVSIKNPEASGGDLAYYLWSSSDHDRQGSNMGYIMAAAAGNLNGYIGGDDADEVVVAFSDADKHLQVVLLNGTSDGGINEMATWRNSDHYRYQMDDIAAAVGDLDGDGYDNEIVLAISDYYSDLQIIVLEYYLDDQSVGWLRELAYHRFIGAGEVDVTTGVFSGSGKDQIAVAFEGCCSQRHLHVGLFEYDSDDSSVKNLSWWESSGNYRDVVNSVSVASGDIDGDKWDEIAIAIADRNDYFQAISLDADTGVLKFRGSWLANSAATDISYVSVDAGDIDSDGKAEIVASFSDYNDLLQMISFDDNPDCPCSGEDTGMSVRFQWQYEQARSTVLAMGDVDGNNLYADYTGKCEETDEMRMIAVVNHPPYWEDWNKDETDIAYGTTTSGAKSSDTEITNTYGGSVTFGGNFEFGEFEIGPSFSKDWEHSTSQSTAHGSSWSQSAGWLQGGDGMVPISHTRYYTYQYQKRDGSGLARVSVPVYTPWAEAKEMTYWNRETGGARTDFPDTWVPAYRTGWMNDRIISETLGDSSQGAGSDYYDIDGDGYSDYVFAWLDNPSEENAIYYRIAWKVHADGNPTNGWSDTYQVGGSDIGWQDSGLGAAVTELNGNSTPELVVAWVANPSGENWAAYKIGWDLDADGKASSWSAKKMIPGWVGDSTQGVGLDIVQFDGDAGPEMFFGWINNPSGFNGGHYRVGWNLDANGDSDNWWTNTKAIEGAFGPEDSGLGLTVADMDSSDQPELVAAWVRDLEGQDDEWAYAVSDDLDHDAYVGSWAPGYGIPSWLSSNTAGVALASANLNHGDDLPELVISWIEDLDGENKAWLQVGKTFPLGGEVDQRPTDIQDDDPDDGRFKIKLYGSWWNVNGKVLWRWDEIPNAATLAVTKDGSTVTWLVDQSQFSDQTTETSESYNFEIGGEAKFLGLGGEGSKSWGFEEGHSQTISWDTGMFLDGKTPGLKDGTPSNKQYQFTPFTYMQEAMSLTGVRQAYMVLDYFVGPLPSQANTAEASVTNIPSSTSSATSLGVIPSAPLITSPSHPDPDTWYATDTATFTWAQPAGDPAVVLGYRWYLDHTPDTIPSGMSFGLTNTTTYKGLSDGQWWLHVRAKGDSGDWSETAHRLIRVDMNPPLVEIVLDPPHPADSGGWYNTPVTAAIKTDDEPGSGAQSIEFSTDGVTWQPYTDPIVFDTDTPLTTLYARATDMAGHISEPVSTTFGLDLTLPVSVEEPGCWDPGGDCEAGVISDTVGNQRLRLSGQLDGSLSGEIGLGIEINGDRWTAADELGEGRWSFTSDTELGAGCHTFKILGEDRAGNVEPLHAFADTVVWHPQERPDLSGSSLSIVPDHVRPGDLVSVTVFAPNSGWQETLVPISVLLPTGLDVLPATIGNDGVYDPAVRTITWPPRYLWPGQENRFTFSAQVDDALPATKLNVSLAALGTWPIAATCPADELPGFQDLQTTVELTTLLMVDPDLPDDDLLAPASPFLRIEEGAATRLRDVQLRISAGADGSASADAVWMYLREWTLSSESGAWVTTQESGWLPYAPSHPWSLSPDDGVKYLGVWLADDAWNISALERSSLAFTNLLKSNQALSDGQRIQYRFPLYAKELAIFNVIAKAGNPDVYVWQPFSGFRPHYSATGTGFVDTVGFQVAKQGVYLVEVKAEGDSQYQLLLGGDIGPSAASSSQPTANTPDHPLTVSDPLSAGVALAPTFPALYLPMMTSH